MSPPLALITSPVETLAALWWFLVLAALMPCVGACLLLFAYELTGGKWMPPIEPTLRRLATMLPFAALAFVPLWLAGSSVFYWVDPSTALLEELTHKRAAFLDPTFFIIRNVFYFVVFGWTAWRLARAGRTRFPAAANLILLALAMLFFVVDWVMIRTPVWWSSGFPFTVMAGGVLAALAIGLLTRKQAVADSGKEIRRALGTLLFAGLILFCYLGLMELIITYAGDLPPERLLYTARATWTASGVMLAAIVLCLLPAFFNLISLDGKTDLTRLRRSAGLLLAVVLAWCWWFIAPLSLESAHSPEQPHPTTEEVSHD